MITDSNYFEPKLDKINQELEKYNSGVEIIRKMIVFKNTKSDITQHFQEIFMNFPYTIETATDKIGISLDLIQLYEYYYSLSDYGEKIDKERIDEIELKKQEFKNLHGNHDIIYDYLVEYTHYLVYRYKTVLENTKNHFFFDGINDEKIILMNLLKRYKSVLKDETKQINIFWGIRLTKDISNIALEILIDFIEQRLKLLTIEIEDIGNEYKTTYIDNNIKPLKWLGTQQELLELIIELNNKNWIPNIEEGDRKKFINSVTNLFDLENTKRSSKTDHSNSLYQKFKGEYIDGKRIFPFLEQQKYERKFNEIKKNNS